MYKTNQELLDSTLSKIKTVIEDTEKKLFDIDKNKKKKNEEISKLRKEVKKDDNNKQTYKQKRNNKIKLYLADFLIEYLEKETTTEENNNLINSLKNLLTSYNINTESFKQNKKIKGEVEEILNEGTKKNIFEEDEDEDEDELNL
ncbi:TPA: hypothetical protein ACPOT5_001744 [Haemophilus influenzae]